MRQYFVYLQILNSHLALVHDLWKAKKKYCKPVCLCEALHFANMAHFNPGVITFGINQWESAISAIL